MLKAHPMALPQRGRSLAKSHQRGLLNAKPRERGLSLVELMVGIAIGLFVVAGATVAVSNQLGDNRRLMLETQIQQDLRAAADLITKDIRRAGYWGNAQDGVWHSGSGTVGSNPYTEIQGPAPGASAASVQFFYSRGVADNAIDDSTEHSGFQLINGTIQMRTGGTPPWQALTDSTTLRVTKFTVSLQTQEIPLTCSCPAGSACPSPIQTVRNVTVQIDGNAVTDATVRRSARSNVRLRNDLITGTCPT